MTYCSYCSEILPPEARFCPACSQPIQSSEANDERLEALLHRRSLRKNHSWLWVMVGCFVFVGMPYLAYLDSHASSSQQGDPSAGVDHATQTFETSRDCSLNDPRARKVATETLALTAHRLSAIEGFDIVTTVENSWNDNVGHGSFYKATVDFNPYHKTQKKTVTLHVTQQASGSCAVVDQTDLH